MKDTVLKIKKHYQIIMAGVLITGVLTCVACNEISKFKAQNIKAQTEKQR